MNFEIRKHLQTKNSLQVVGNTSVKRSNFGSVLLDGMFYSAGGFGDFNNEGWKFVDRIATKQNTIISYALFPELIPVKFLGENCVENL